MYRMAHKEVIRKLYEIKNVLVIVTKLELANPLKHKENWVFIESVNNNKQYHLISLGFVKC